MPTIERQPPAAAVEAARGQVEPGQVGTYIFGRRRVESNFWQPQDRWLSQILAPPQSEEQEEAGPTLLASSEVSMERVSLTPGLAVIELTDDEAQQIMDSHAEDAFPPE